MPDDAPRPEDSERTDESPSRASADVSGEAIGLLAAEAAVAHVSAAVDEAPSRALGPLRSVPAGLWPDIPGVFFPEPYALDFEWRDGVPESAIRAREMVASRDDAGESGDDTFERAPIDLQTGDLEMVAEEDAFYDDAEPTIEMEVEVGEADVELDGSDGVEAAVSVYREAPDSIQPLDDAEIEEIVDVAEAALEHDVPELAAVSPRPAPPPTPSSLKLPKPDRASSRRLAPPVAAPPLPADATGQHAPSERDRASVDAAPADEARVLPLERVRPFRKLQGPRPTMAQPNLIEAALGAVDSGKAGGTSMSGQARPWYEAIFDESFFNFLPKTLHKQTRKESKFAHESLRLADGARILDVACGFGRHSVELAKRGYQMTGLDLSSQLIDKAREEASRRKMDIELERGDMRELHYDQEFDGALLMGQSFGYFDDQTNVEVLEGIHRALKPRGRFLVHMLNRDRVVRELPEVIWWRGQDSLLLEEIEFDPETSRMQSKRTVVFDDGRPPWEQYIEIRLYSLHEIYSIFETIGFRVADVSGSLNHRGAFFPNESRDLLILTERERELI